jgi:hypothetical protein
MNYLTRLKIIFNRSNALRWNASVDAPASSLLNRINKTQTETRTLERP